MLPRLPICRANKAFVGQPLIKTTKTVTKPFAQATVAFVFFLGNWPLKLQ